MKNLAFFDLDKTIYNTHSFFQILNYFVDSKITSLEAKTKIYEIAKAYKQGSVSYSMAANEMLKIWATDLKGKNVKTIENLTTKFFQTNRNNFYTYWERILPALLNNYEVYLVTTNTQFTAKAVTALFNLTGAISTVFEESSGVFTGNITQNLAMGKSLVTNIIKNYPNAKTIAFGDSENDIEMLSLVNTAFCFNPDDKLKEKALNNKWLIIDESNAFDIIKKNI